MVWNPWISQIEKSGKGKPLFTSRDMPGLIADLLVAQEKSLKEKRKDFVGMAKAWYDTEKFIRENPAEASKIMAKVVGLKAEEYQVFIKGTRFFNEADNLKALGSTTDSKSLLKVGPSVLKFLTDNKLIEGKPNLQSGIDASIVKDAQKK